MIIQQAQL